MMKKSLEILKSNGCEMDAAFKRCVCDEDFLLDCITRSLVDPSIEKLGEAIKEKDTDKIFSESHNLKGLLGNVGLTNLCKINDIMVESSRNGIADGLDDPYHKFLTEVEKTKEILKTLD